MKPGPYYVPEPYQRPDYSERYNTNLSSQEAAFQEWLRANPALARELMDYDLRAAWFMRELPSQGKRKPGLYTKPNHPTFSRDSIYEGAPHEKHAEGMRGGRWARYFVPGKGTFDMFEASPWNVENMGGADALREYFKRFEPDAILRLPGEY